MINSCDLFIASVLSLAGLVIIYPFDEGWRHENLF